MNLQVLRVREEIQNARIMATHKPGAVPETNENADGSSKGDARDPSKPFDVLSSSGRADSFRVSSNRNSRGSLHKTTAQVCVQCRRRAAGPGISSRLLCECVVVLISQRHTAEELAARIQELKHQHADVTNAEREAKKSFEVRGAPFPFAGVVLLVVAHVALLG